jgi:predicted MFS family arabinose efflux permease
LTNFFDRPIIGGYLNQGLGWRSNFWFLAIFALCIWIAIFFLLPETSRSFPTQEPTEKQGAQYIEKKAKIRTMNPLSALRLLLYPNIALVVAYVGVL